MKGSWRNTGHAPGLRILCLCGTEIFMCTLAATAADIEVTPRILTRNGDGRNDRIHLTYDNPQGDTLLLRVWDARGVLVWEEPLSNTSRERPLPDGRYRSFWDGSVFSAAGPAPGAYVLAVTAGGVLQFRAVIAVVR